MGRFSRCAGCARPARRPRSAILRAGEWLRSIQNADGGWGESCSSYDQDCFVPAESTPSQTAWALDGPDCRRRHQQPQRAHGIEYLLDTQRSDGGWDEELATGTGFPGVFYLNYHYYRLYFPLIALSEFVWGRHSAWRRRHAARFLGLNPMRFPLSMTAGMAGYIFKNRMRPRPEWQKDVAAAPDATNPFRILHCVPAGRANASRIP